MIRIFTIAFVLLGIAAPIAQAATYFVATTGNDTDPGTESQPFRTIGRGIAASADGDTILVADGTYDEHGLDFGARNLTLRSQNGNPSACVLDCQRLGNGIFIRGGQTTATLISGLTVRNAIVVGTPFSGSFGSSALYLSNSSVTIANCVFIDNNSNGGNGVLIGSGGSAVLNNCVFTSSTAQLFSGSALAVRGNGATVTDCTFSNNRYVSLELTSGTSTVTGCTFTGNNTIGTGGGMSMAGGYATLANCSFTGNSGASGGGIGMDAGNLTLSRCSFNGNDGHNFGGGLALYGGSVAANDCTFLGNRVQVRGGAIGVSSGTAALNNCVIARNTSDFGWGCALDLSLSSNATVTMTHCTLAENFSGGQRSGGAILFNEGNTLTVVNGICWDVVSSQGVTEIVTNNNGATSVTYSNVRGGHPGAGNMDSAPLFVDAAANNYRLLAASPCINAGSATAPNLPATDILGTPRILGIAPDMGAYEFWSAASGTWFVDLATGADTNSGSPDAPLMTVTRAVSVAGNGHLVYVKRGNYGTDATRITKSLRMFNWGNTGSARIGQP